jgi:hypothetical protein
MIMVFLLGFVCGAGFCLVVVSVLIVWTVKADLEVESRFLREEQARVDRRRHAQEPQTQHPMAGSTSEAAE